MNVGVRAHSGANIKNGELNEFSRERLMNLMQRLVELRATAWDAVAPTNGVQIAANPTGALSWGIDLNVKEKNVGYLPLTPWAKSQVASITGIPKRYFDLMDSKAPELLVKNVQHWFGASGKAHLFRVQQGHIRAVLSDRYAPLDNHDLGWMALKAAKDCPGAAFDSASITDTRLYLRILNMDRQVDLNGDKYIPGVVVSNSEVGAGSTKAVPYLFRSSCSNGMILTAKAASKIHLGSKLDVGVFTPETIKVDAKATFMRLRDVIVSTLTKTTLFEDFFDSITEAKERRVKPSVFLENLGSKFNLTEAEKSSILDQLTADVTIPAELKATQWGISNAITAYAKGIEANRRYDLQKIGADTITLSEAEVERLVAE